MSQTSGAAFKPNFETWVNACFTLSKSDEFWASSQLTSQELAENLARLFENPAFLGAKFTRQQLADGLWLICGCVLGFFHEALDPSVPLAARQRWLRAIKICYTDLFDPLCSSVPMNEQNSDPFCVAVFMLWDMDSLAYAQTFHDLQQDCLDIMQAALNCQSNACIKSGLHGLGHWIEWAEYDGDAELRERLVKSIDDFVCRYPLPCYTRLMRPLYRFVGRRSDPTLELVTYAKDARSGRLL